MNSHSGPESWPSLMDSLEMGVGWDGSSKVDGTMAYDVMCARVYRTRMCCRNVYTQIPRNVTLT